MSLCFVEDTGWQLYFSEGWGRDFVVTPGRYCSTYGVVLFSPTFGVASVAFPGLTVGRMRIAYYLREQEQQLEVIISESRAGVGWPVPQGPALPAGVCRSSLWAAGPFVSTWCSVSFATIAVVSEELFCRSV